MPAEWELHEATWLSWPHKEASWPGAFEPVPEVFAQIAGVLSESELVRINVADEEMADGVRQMLKRGGVSLDAVRFHLNPTNDAWVRDHGPMYVVRDVDGRRERAIVDWEYNAWGGNTRRTISTMRFRGGSRRVRRAGVQSRDRDGGRLDRHQRHRRSADDVRLPAAPES
jgi:agmatine/peptidylarginine deiminase